MIYGVIGPRDFHGQEYRNKAYVHKVLETFTDMTQMVSGGSLGVEKLAEQYAAETELPFIRIPPKQVRHQPVAKTFLIRNHEIILASQALILFWDAEYQVVLDTLALCTKSLKEATIIPMQ